MVPFILSMWFARACSLDSMKPYHPSGARLQTEYRYIDSDIGTAFVDSAYCIERDSPLAHRIG